MPLATGITAVWILRFIWKWTRRIVFGFLLLSIAGALLFRFVPVPFTWLMVSRSFGHVIQGESPKLKKSWVRLEAIPNHMQLAAVCAEDQNFLSHHGFDFEAIKAAMEYNKTHDKKRGASTISQQTAKNTFLWEGRSWLRKGLETWFTLLIELFWSKARIMEVYLNVIEFGDGIYGVNAAATEYYGKTADQLSRKQAAELMSIVPSPRKWKPGKGYSVQRTNHILRQMNNHGGLLDYNR